MSDAIGTDDTRALEALFFVSDEPLTSSVLAQALEVDRRTVEAMCDRLARELDERNAGLVLRNVAGGWRLYTHPDAAATVERFVLSSRQARLTKAALETLAIVAYKQPVTRHQVSAVRGVNSDGVLRALVDRGLVEEAGREETPGRPVLYATTPQFLERLGLPSLAALPSLAPLLGADGDEAGALADQVAEDGSSNDRSARRDVTVLGDEDDDPVDDGDDDAAAAAAEVVSRGADADPDDHPSVAEVDPGAG
jgi:segregation and condensation protein B